MALPDENNLNAGSFDPGVNVAMPSPPSNQTFTFDATQLTEPMKVLLEGLQLMMKKASDYQAAESSVRQADYYPNGIITLLDIIHAKKLRLNSVIDKARAGKTANFESIEDSLKDMMNYCAIAAAWCRKGIDGQNQTKDIFNK